MDKIALFDMDGTLADYDDQMRTDLARLAAPYDQAIQNLHNVPPWLEARMDLIKAQTDWWLNLPEIPLGIGLFRMSLEIGFKPCVLSKGPFRATAAWTEKVKWCRKFLDPIYKQPVDINIVTNKGLTYGSMLVDDYVPYIKDWLKWRPRGIVLMPAHPWNEDFKHHQVLRVSSVNLDEAKKWMIKAYKRKNGK